MKIPFTLLALAPIFAFGLAGGMNLYVTVATLGIGSRFGLIDPVPPELRGLEHGLVIGAALAFMLIETAAERTPFIDSIWAAIHTVVKPIGAALLALSLMGPDPAPIRLFIAASAGTLALFAHASRGSVSPSADQPRRPLAELGIHALHSTAAVALVLTYQDRPGLTLLLSAVLIVWIATLGPRSWRALLLTLLAQIGRVRALAGPSRWRQPHELPSDVRPLLPTPALASAPARAVRAGLKGLPGVGAYRNGWLVFTPDETMFLFRTLLGPRRISIPAIHATTVVPGPWLDAVQIVSQDGSRYTLLLMKDGPRPELAAEHLAPPAS